jgi:hypothetical protein
MINYILIFVATIIFASVVGLCVTKVVDRKLSNVSINIPSPNLTVNFEHSKIQKKEPFITESGISVNFDGPIDDDKILTPIPQAAHTMPLEMPMTQSKQAQLGPNAITVLPPTQTEKVRIGCKKDSDCNVVNGPGNVCKSDGTCHCVKGSGLFCQYGPTNYKDPKDMTASELERFKFKFRNNMTLQDYKNWLMLYENDSELLRQHHRQNLRKLLRGGILTVQDIPTVRKDPPMTAADYFTKMYEGGRISVHFPDNDSPYVGANYTDYSDFIAPENQANTFITGVVDIYKEGKDDAKALNYFLRPDATMGIEERRIGERYQNELRKHHDLADLRRIIVKEDPVLHQALEKDLYVDMDKALATFQSKDSNVKVN